MKMFYCKCGYHTCKKSYKTKLARTQHIAGVKSARKKETDRKSTNDKNSKNNVSKNVLLQPKDCLKACHFLSNVFEYIKELKNKHVAAKIISNPRIPNTLSEPIVIHLLKNKKLIPELAKYDLHKGGNGADISAIYKSSLKKIQVKATGKSDFITMGKKDMKADYFIWLRFGNAFEIDTFSRLTIFIIKKPNKYPRLAYWSKNSNKITYEQFKDKIGGVKLKKINLNNLL